jgi:translation elongation factor P/translation initiation factor 5A
MNPKIKPTPAGYWAESEETVSDFFDFRGLTIPDYLELLSNIGFGEPILTNLRNKNTSHVNYAFYYRLSKQIGTQSLVMSIWLVTNKLRPAQLASKDANVHAIEIDATAYTLLDNGSFDADTFTKKIINTTGTGFVSEEIVETTLALATLIKEASPKNVTHTLNEIYKILNPPDED